MRKYYQAALAIIAAVSLISLLIYRHEYNKLRYVLEVFNYFGKPNIKAETNCTSNLPVFTKFNPKFDEPVSSWQRLDDNLYVYSAYSIHEKEIQVIGFGALNSIKDMQCVIYFENEDKPVLGLFKSVPIINSLDTSDNQQKSNYKGYHFLCGHTKNKVPTGITFLTNSEANVNTAPILPVSVSPHNLQNSSVALCVVPPLTKQMKTSDMISFINFYDLIGMDNFIVYDYGIPNKFNSYLKSMAMAQNPYWKFTYTVLSWNFPFSNVDYNTMNSIIQADCLYRTFNKALYVSVLSWEEYLVLKYHHSVIDLMADFKKSKMKSDRYKLTTSTFCTQQVDDINTFNTTFTIFRKTHYSANINEGRPTYIFDPSEVLRKTKSYTREISKDLVVLNLYKHCNERGSLETLVHDISILRFIEDVQNSSLYRKFASEKDFALTKS